MGGSASYRLARKIANAKANGASQEEIDELERQREAAREAEREKRKNRVLIPENPQVPTGSNGEKLSFGYVGTDGYWHPTRTLQEATEGREKTRQERENGYNIVNQGDELYPNINVSGTGYRPRLIATPNGMRTPTAEEEIRQIYEDYGYTSSEFPREVQDRLKELDELIAKQRKNEFRTDSRHYYRG